jgi:hypothetical protein
LELSNGAQLDDHDLLLGKDGEFSFIMSILDLNLTHPHLLLLRLRLCGAIPSLPHTSVWHDVLTLLRIMLQNSRTENDELCQYTIQYF